MHKHDRSLFVISLIGILSIGYFDGSVIDIDYYAHAQTAEDIQYTEVEGSYRNDELGFELSIPDSLKGFVYEYESGVEDKSVTLQIHPESNSTAASCCPTIDTSPAVFLLDSGPLSTLSSPVPFTNDLYTAIQGYGMRMSIEELNDKQVLLATLESERNDLPGYDSVKRVGKFYFMNNDQRFISYGLWASEENYQIYLDEFEESAKTLLIDNMSSVDLQSIFRQYTLLKEVNLKDGSILNPEIVTPSIIESIAIDEDTNTVRINITEPTGNSFLVLNSGDLLDGPLSITFDGKPIEATTMSNENGEFIVAFYDQDGNHEVAVTGTAVIPEFGSSAIAILGALSLGVVLVYMRSNPKFIRN